MKRKSEKCRRRLMVLLASVCMLCEIPYTMVTVSASESTVSIEKEDNEVLEQAETLGTGQTDTEKTENATEDNGQTEDNEQTESSGQTEDAGQAEDVKEPDADDSGQIKDADEVETDGSEKTEERENESGGMEETENPEEKEQTGETEETEDEEIEEDSEEALMLLSEETGDEDGSGEEYVTDDTYTDENGVVYHYYGYEDGTADIYELESYIIADKQGKAINIPADIGGYTVTKITFRASGYINFPSITIPETITYIGNCAFKNANISELDYNAAAASSEATGGNGGSFNWAVIDKLNIGENVRVIPDALFENAKINMDELVLDVESIGEYAFCGRTTITNLVIGEGVKEIGIHAFREDSITNLHYNAINATIRHEAALAGPFYFDTISSISFGEKVETIPNNLFVYVHYSADSLELPESVITIGEYAFYSSFINIGELTIGKNVSSIGMRAFAGIDIGVLNYNAAEVEIPGMKAASSIWNPFYATRIGELRFGEGVRVLPDYLFYCVKLEQDTLVIPDSVISIGADVLSCRSNTQQAGKMSIGTLIIGKNVSYMGRWAFGSGNYEKVIIYSTKSGGAVMPSYTESALPVCGSVEIHRGASCYRYFTAKAEADNITLMCEDFETAYGGEHYDEGKDCFVRCIMDRCVVCGYETVREEYEDAYTVLFQMADGEGISCQHLHSGEDAVEPEAPERTGYEFTGWDKDFTSVTSNITITAQYKVRTFSVVFKDGDNVISEQEIGYGSDAEVPEEPARDEEEWGMWKFSGWIGDYTNIVKDMTIRAQFEKVFHEYEVVFYDEEGNVLSRQIVKYGEKAEAPDAPEKKATAQYTYTFAGWNGDTANITANAAFYPVYVAEKRTYTVTFMNGDTVFDTQKIEYGASAVTPDEPKKEADAGYSYIFIGWDSDYSVITGDMVIHALYEQKKIPPKEKPDEENGKDKKPGGGKGSGGNGSGGDGDNGDGTNPAPDDDGDNGTESVSDNEGEGAKPETEKGNVENTDDGTDNIAEGQENNAEILKRKLLWELPQVTLPETEESAEAVTEELEEIIVGEALQGDTGKVEVSQETVAGDNAESSGDMSVLGWFLMLAGMIVLACLLLWMFLLYLAGRKVKVCGKILDESGGVPCGIQLTLLGKEILETEPDEAGFFSFEGLKKDYYGLNVYNGDGAKIFSADIRMEAGSGEDVFIILESGCSNVETNVKMGKYEVNLTV